MKRLLPLICILIIIQLVSSSAAYAQERQPSHAEINNAVSWAESLEGEESFPFADGSGTCPSWYECGTFTANAYGSSAFCYYSAYLLWFNSDRQHPGDWNAPRGSLVFFDRVPGTSTKGHVALSLGNGELIEAGYSCIMKTTLRAESKAAPYLGWAWPPSDWPGRKSGPVSAVIIVPIAIVLTIVLTLGFRLIFLKHAKANLLPFFNKKTQKTGLYPIYSNNRDWKIK